MAIPSRAICIARLGTPFRSARLVVDSNDRAKDMTRLARALCVAVGVGALYLAFDTVSMLSSYFSAEHRVVIYPYVVTLQETVTRAGGAGIVVGATETWALRADGARMYRREVIGRNGMAMIGRSIFLPSGARLEIDDVRELVTTGWASERSLASSLRDPESGCRDSFLGRTYSVKQVPVGSQTFGDYLSFGFRQGNSTLWYAPDAGCALIAQQGVQSEDGFKSDKNLVSLEIGEPPLSLFAVGARHREVAPSIVFGYSAGDPVGHMMDQRYHDDRRNGSSR